MSSGSDDVCAGFAGRQDCVAGQAADSPAEGVLIDRIVYEFNDTYINWLSTKSDKKCGAHVAAIKGRNQAEAEISRERLLRRQDCMKCRLLRPAQP